MRSSGVVNTPRISRTDGINPPGKKAWAPFRRRESWNLFGNFIGQQRELKFAVCAKSEHAGYKFRLFSGGPSGNRAEIGLCVSGKPPADRADDMRYIFSVIGKRRRHSPQEDPPAIR